MLKLNPKLLQEAFPINKVEVFFDAEDHSNFLGFTWEMISQGRVPVGLDTSDTNFNEIGKTGGSKYLQKHSHKILTYNQYANGTGGTYDGSEKIGKTTTGADGNSEVSAPISSSGTGNSGNLQPYIVVAFWKRIA